jgi:glucose-6-phosphate 1-dehydrogenase
MNKKNKQIEDFNSFHIVVFGGDGDLALRKIYPALFHRQQDGQFSKDFKLIAITRKKPNKPVFTQELIKFLKASEGDRMKLEEIEYFAKQIELIQVENQETESYYELANLLNENPHYQHIYYFSTPSSAFGPISRALKNAGLVNEKSKVVIEKPLGHSLASSNAINEEISEAFKEHQIYRIDHYLGKETVQNLMVLRFANNLFERAWDSEHIENIQITVAESLGVEKRAAYYDNSGALLDMVQNHLLQLLCLVAMEPPSLLEADEVRNEKLKVLRSLRPLTKKTVQTDTVKGQYTRGTIKGEQVNSYLEDIEKYNSKTETFVAIKSGSRELDHLEETVVESDIDIMIGNRLNWQCQVNQAIHKAQ